MTAIFAIVCDGPAHFEYEKLQAWGLVCLAYEIDELWYVDQCKGEARLPPEVKITIPNPRKVLPEKIQFHEQRMKAKSLASLAAALDEAKQLRTIFVEGPAVVGTSGVELVRYRHPRDAIYLFGGDRSSGLATAAHAKLDADWVAIRARRGTYGFLAGAIVAQHRYQQRDR